MKTKLLLLATCSAVTLGFTGCATNNARVIDTGGRESITTVGDINDKDFTAAATDAINSLLASGALDKVAAPPAIVAVSLIQNRTGLHYDTSLLTKKIRVAISQSGKALTATPAGEDPQGTGLAAEQRFLEDKKVAKNPDFTLSGKILKTQVRAGKIREATYTFQLSLTAPGSLAVALWEFERQITKQGDRPAVGF